MIRLFEDKKAKVAASIYAAETLKEPQIEMWSGDVCVTMPRGIFLALAEAVRRFEGEARPQPSGERCPGCGARWHQHVVGEGCGWVLGRDGGWFSPEEWAERKP